MNSARPMITSFASAICIDLRHFRRAWATEFSYSLSFMVRFRNAVWCHDARWGSSEVQAEEKPYCPWVNSSSLKCSFLRGVAPCKSRVCQEAGSMCVTVEQRREGLVGTCIGQHIMSRIICVRPGIGSRFRVDRHCAWSTDLEVIRPCIVQASHCEEG